MTRFIITLEQGVNLVKTVLDEMFGGEIFVPKLLLENHRFGSIAW